MTVSPDVDAAATPLYGSSGVAYVTCSINDLGYNTANCTPTFTANGHVDFYAVDNATNPSSIGAYTVTNIDKLAPILTPLSPVEGAFLTDVRPVFTALVTETQSGLQAYQLYLDQTLVTPTLTGNTLTYAPALALADGPHGYTLDAQDNARNEAILAVQFTVDTATWVSITAPLNESVFNQGVIPHVAIQTEDTPGTDLTLTVNGTLYTHVLTATGGLWLLNDVPLADGANTLTAFVRDPAGNTATHTIGVTQDATRDVAQARADHSPANPTLQALPFYLTAQAGVGRAVEQWTFRIWSALTPTVMIISGALPVIDTVRLWDGQDLIGQPVADGDYSYQLVLTTTGGLATASPVGTVQVSRAAPDVPSIACPANPWFSHSPLYLTGTASSGARVVVYQDGARVNVVAPSGGAWQSLLLFTGQPPYTTTVTARSEDTALNLSAPSAPCVVGFSATDPFTLPHASISTGVLGLNRAATLNATTRATGAPVAWVRAYTPPGETPLELKPVFTNAFTKTYTANWIAPGSGVFQGIAALDFRAEDTATPAVRGEQFVQFWLDLVPPFVELAWPESGYAQANPTLTILGRAEISSTVTITATSGAALRTAVVNVDDFNRWQVTLTLPDGVWTITARATDRAGNVGPAASLNSIVIDTTPPTLSAPVVTPYFARSGRTLTATVTITDATSGVSWAQTDQGRLDAIGGNQYQTVFTAMGVDGTRAMTLTARDTLDNESTRTFTDAYMVDGTNPAISPPTLTATGSGQYLTGTTLYYGPIVSATLTVSVMASDTGSGVESVVFPALFGASAWADTVAPYQRIYTIGGAASGTYSPMAVDRAGNSASPSPFAVTYDSTGPMVNNLTATPIDATTVRVTWDGQDDASGVAGYAVEVQEDRGNWQSLTTTTQPQVDFTGQLSHRYAFRVTATDRVGNAGAPQTSPDVVLEVVTKYYLFGGQRVAMRKNGVVSYLHGDHLGSASLVTNQTGGVVSEARYKPYGETRWTNAANPTDYRFTGQRSEEATLGSLYDYGARFYSPVLGRFISADTVVPSAGNPQAFNRYAYVGNNPLKYIDPSGHVACNGPNGECWGWNNHGAADILSDQQLYKDPSILWKDAIAPSDVKVSVPFPASKDSFFNKGRLYAGCRGYGDDCTTIHTYDIQGRADLLRLFGVLGNGMKDDPASKRISEALIWWGIETASKGIPLSIFNEMRPSENEMYGTLFDDYLAYQLNSSHADNAPLAPVKVTFIDSLYYYDLLIGGGWVWKYSRISAVYLTPGESNIGTPIRTIPEYVSKALQTNIADLVH